MSGHAVYQTLLQRLIQLSGVLDGGPDRRARLSARSWPRSTSGRARRSSPPTGPGLLATQDPATAFRVHMKLASGGHLDDLDATSFFAQGAEYDDADLRDSVLKLLLIENRIHPFAVVRATELRRWVDSGDYTRILGGDYPRRDDRRRGQGQRGRAPRRRRSYSEAFRAEPGRVGKLVHDAAGCVGSARLWLDEKLRRDGAD